MQMEFNPEEVKYIDNLMERHMTGLIREINHTDSFEYKKDLRNEADFLGSLKRKIAQGLSEAKAS